MRSDSLRIPIAACVVAAAAVFTRVGPSPAAADEPPGTALVGSWEREGKVNVFSADGTGTNNDASRFRWELKETRLIARRQTPDGKLDEEWLVLIVFTNDRKEFSYLLGADNGGLQRVTFHKLDNNGKRFEGRTDADRAYPPDAEALRGKGPPGESAPRASTPCVTRARVGPQFTAMVHV